LGLSYRFLQFQRALLARPTASELELAAELLTPEQYGLFLRLQPGEQAHSLKILHALRAEGQENPDLLAASLLHDVGKSRHPLKTWERVVIVLGKVFLPKQARDWGDAQPGGWRRPFVIARQHPDWGAEMTAQIGASNLLVELIRRHQDELPAQPVSESDRLLAILKKYDDQT